MSRYFTSKEAYFRKLEKVKSNCDYYYYEEGKASCGFDIFDLEKAERAYFQWPGEKDEICYLIVDASLECFNYGKDRVKILVPATEVLRALPDYLEEKTRYILKTRSPGCGYVDLVEDGKSLFQSTEDGKQRFFPIFNYANHVEMEGG